MKTKKEPGVLEIARRTKLSGAHVSKVMSGKRNPSLGAAALIATALHISIDELYMRLSGIQARLPKVEVPV